MIDVFLSGFFAACAGLISAFSGGGYSFVLFPMLLLFIPGAYAATLAVTKVGTVALSLTSGKIHLSRHQFNRNLLIILVISGLVGTAIGTYLIQYHLQEVLYKKILSCVVISSACYLLISKNKGLGVENETKITSGILLITFISIGSISILNGLFGGTGILMTLYMVAVLRMSFIRSTAHMMLSAIPLNIVQTGYLLITEPFRLDLLVAIFVGSIMGSWCGTRLQYLKGNIWVRRSAIVIMLLICIRLFIR